MKRGQNKTKTKGADLLSLNRFRFFGLSIYLFDLIWFESNKQWIRFIKRINRAESPKKKERKKERNWFRITLAVYWPSWHKGLVPNINRFIPANRLYINRFIPANRLYINRFSFERFIPKKCAQKSHRRDISPETLRVRRIFACRLTLLLEIKFKLLSLKKWSGSFINWHIYKSKESTI